MKIQTGSHLLLYLLVAVFSTTHSTAQFGSKYFLTDDGVQLHYLEAGSGPTLVLVPGWTMPAEIWEPQIRYFSSSYRVIALDPRGHGRSEKPAHGYHPLGRARDINDLLNHLGDEPVILAGWSIAGMEVLVYLKEYGSEAVRAAIIVDWDINYETPRDFTGRFISMQLEREEWMEDFVRLIHRTPQPDAYFQRLTRACLSMPETATAMIIANFILSGLNDQGPILDSLDIPVLAIFSSLNWAQEAAREVREGWPHFQVEVIEETSHALFVDQPEAFNRAMENFLNSLPK